MNEEASTHDLPTSGVFKGIIRGDARVRSGSTLEVKGIISGDLHVEAGSTVLITGIVSGRVINDGAEVNVRGIIGK